MKKFRHPLAISFLRILEIATPLRYTVRIRAWHFGMNPDPDPRIRASDLQIRIRFLLFSSLTFKRQQKNIFFLRFAYYFLKVQYIHIIFKDKRSKKSQNSRNQGFSYHFCLMIEGSGAVPLTNVLHFTKRLKKNLFFKLSCAKMHRSQAHFVTSSTFSAFFGTILEPSDFDHIPRKVFENSFSWTALFCTYW